MIGSLETSNRTLAILSGNVRMPLRGIWTAFIEIDLEVGAEVPIGPVDIALAGDDSQPTAQLRGTIRAGDAIGYEGRARCIVRAGMGAIQSTPLTQRDYLKSPFDVPVGLIIRDAVEDAGESLADDAEANLNSFRVPRWHRAGGTTGQATLDRLAERFGFGWRFNDLGSVEVITNESYPAISFSIEEQIVHTGLNDGYSKMLEVAPPSATLRPGQTILGRRVDEVVYRIDSSSLRAELYYDIASGGTAHEVARTIRAATAPLVYRELHEAVVRRQNGDGSLDIEAVDARVGKLSGVPYASGIVGCRMRFAEGTRVRIGWQDGDESRPIVIAPEMLKPPLPTDLDPWGAAVSRVGDSVDAGSLTLSAVAHPSGAIASIVITYLPPVGPPTILTLLPTGTPISLPIGGKIQTGSPEVFIRGEDLRPS